MSRLSDPRRSPWLTGALLLVLAAALVAPLVSLFGWRRWPYLAGLGALLLLAFGGIERAWQRFVLPRPPRAAKRGRFRLLSGGKRKGNGRPHDSDPEDGGDEPRWLM